MCLAKSITLSTQHLLYLLHIHHLLLPMDPMFSFENINQAGSGTGFRGGIGFSS